MSSLFTLVIVTMIYGIPRSLARFFWDLWGVLIMNYSVKVLK